MHKAVLNFFDANAESRKQLKCISFLKNSTSIWSVLNTCFIRNSSFNYFSIVQDMNSLSYRIKSVARNVLLCSRTMLVMIFLFKVNNKLIFP